MQTGTQSILDIINITLSVAGTPLELKNTFRRRTWPSVINSYGPVPANEVSFTLSAEVTDPERPFMVFQRDYLAQESERMAWRSIKERDEGDYRTVAHVQEGITAASTNNLQILFFGDACFFVIAITVQVSPKGNLCVVAEQTWHGNIFRHEDGSVYVPDLERVEDHPLLRIVQAEYATDDLPPRPHSYAFWANKIDCRGLEENERVVILMDTPQNGGTYYTRNRRGHHGGILASNIAQGKSFPTVGTILKEDGGGRWQALPEDECFDIFRKRLNFDPTSQKILTVLPDMQRALSGTIRSMVWTPGSEALAGALDGVVEVQEV